MLHAQQLQHVAWSIDRRFHLRHSVNSATEFFISGSHPTQMCSTGDWKLGGLELIVTLPSEKSYFTDRESVLPHTYRYVLNPALCSGYF